MRGRYHAPVNDILDLWVPGGIVGSHVHIVEHIEYRVRVLEAAEFVQLAVSDTKHEVTGAPGVDHAVDGIVYGIVELQDVSVHTGVSLCSSSFAQRCRSWDHLPEQEDKGNTKAAHFAKACVGKGSTNL